MDDLNSLRKFYQLKKVRRANSVGKRKESPAEHSWSSLILADYFLSKYKRPLDRLNIYELLMYHDVIEIVCGDVDVLDVKKRKDLDKKEREAMNLLKKEIAPILKEKIIKLFAEYQERKLLKLNLPKRFNLWTQKFMKWIIKKIGKDGQRNFSGKLKNLCLKNSLRYRNFLNRLLDMFGSTVILNHNLQIPIN